MSPFYILLGMAIGNGLIAWTVLRWAERRWP